MHDCELKKAPDFAALSYCWGASGYTRTISVNEQYLTIGENLYHALRDLMQHHTTTWLWIDAVCINQADTAERSRQVQLMGDIFSHADVVLAYLGEGDEWTAQGFQQVLDGDDWEPPPPVITRSKWITDAWRRNRANPAQTLLQVAYWTRTWIVQGATIQ